MKNLLFRSLNPNEILVRVERIFDDYISLLLYKDARVDEQLLDEVVGPYNWKRTHREVIMPEGGYCQACTISIYDEEKGEWVEKEDFGSDGFLFEKSKAMASDSFKRAGVAWGIGRELYTAPDLYVKAEAPFANVITKDDGRRVCYDEFIVTQVCYDSSGHSITALQIKNKSTNQIVIHYDIRTDMEKLESKIRAEEQKLEEKKANSVLFQKAKALNIDVNQTISGSPTSNNYSQLMNLAPKKTSEEAAEKVAEQRKELERMSPRGLSKVFLTSSAGSKEASLCEEIAKEKGEEFLVKFNEYVACARKEN